MYSISWMSATMVTAIQKHVLVNRYLKLLFLGIICIHLGSASNTLKEFSLARYGITTFANNSFVGLFLVGEGYPGITQTDGGALECHTDDTTCCRGIDNPPNGVGRGEWYYPNGTVVSPPGGGLFYRTRNHMVVRLNRGPHVLSPSGVYRCVIPGTGGVTITRYITLVADSLTCTNLPEVTKGTVSYTPPRHVSAKEHLSRSQRHTGTIATYNCSSGYQLVGGSSLRACGPDGNWNGTEPACEDESTTEQYTDGETTTADTTTEKSTTEEITTEETTTEETTTEKTTTEEITTETTTSETTTEETTTEETTSGVTTTEKITTATLATSDSGTTDSPVVFIQLRFTNIPGCQEYCNSILNTQLKIDSITATITKNIVMSCGCQFNTSFLLNGQLRCFDESPQIVTFRIQLSETSQTNTTELVLYIEQWIRSSEGLVVEGFYLAFDTTCPLIIESFDSIECPGSLDVQESGTGGIVAGSISAVLLIFLAAVVIVVIIVVCHLKRKQANE